MLTLPMLQGKCPKCGDLIYGWALRQPIAQYCKKCGVGLVITTDDGRVFKGYSPYTEQPGSLNPSLNVTPQDVIKEVHSKSVPKENS